VTVTGAWRVCFEAYAAGSDQWTAKHPGDPLHTVIPHEDKTLRKRYSIHVG
jgi:hypothetical protein